MFSFAFSPILAAQPATSLTVVVIIILLLCFAAYAAMRGSKGAAIFCLVVAIIMLVCNPEAYLTPVEFLGNIGISPNAQVLSLLGILLLVTYLIAGLKPLAGHKHGYLFTKSKWLTGLMLWAIIADIAAISAIFSATYDYSGDNMMKDLNKNQFRISSTVEFTGTAELLNDKAMSANSATDTENKQDIPSIPLMSELLADTSYQVTPPSLIMKDQAPEKPHKYVERGMEPKPAGKTEAPQSGGKISQADYAELKRYISNLENRRYIQERSLKQRRSMLPLLKEIANGSNVNTQKKELGDWTALHFSCAIGDVNLTRWLLLHGADQNLKNKSGDTPAKCIGPNHGSSIRDLLNKYKKK